MRRILIALAAFAVTFSPVPAHAQICTPFTDVAASDPFCSNIQWMYNRGITLGCTANQYCPAQFVRRDQMAAFMFRLGFQNAFLKEGNAFGATAVLGTTDNQALDVRVNNSRVMRYEPNANGPNVIGGYSGNNVKFGIYGATIGGGGGVIAANEVTGVNGTVAGGSSNRAGGPSGYTGATVRGGILNSADGYLSTIAGGSSNQAPGWTSFVAGGANNQASGDGSFAAGKYARADGQNCAVFSLWGSQPGMPCFGTSSQFFIGALHGLSVDYHSQRADGGGNRYVYIGDNFPPYTITTWNGATLTDAGVWTNASDAGKKDAFAEVDKRAVLDKLTAMPIRSWRYRVEADDIRHIGPTAQDFMAAFGLGYDDKMIGTIDADGVALAAIQGLNAKLEATLAERDAQIASLARDLAQERTAREAQAQEVAGLRQAVAVLLGTVKDANRIAAHSP